MKKIELTIARQHKPDKLKNIPPALLKNPELLGHVREIISALKHPPKNYTVKKIPPEMQTLERITRVSKDLGRSDGREHINLKNKNEFEEKLASYGINKIDNIDVFYSIYLSNYETAEFQKLLDILKELATTKKTKEDFLQKPISKKRKSSTDPQPVESSIEIVADESSIAVKVQDAIENHLERTKRERKHPPKVKPFSAMKETPLRSVRHWARYHGNTNITPASKADLENMLIEKGLKLQEGEINDFYKSYKESYNYAQGKLRKEAKNNAKIGLFELPVDQKDCGTPIFNRQQNSRDEANSVGTSYEPVLKKQKSSSQQTKASDEKKRLDYQLRSVSRCKESQRPRKILDFWARVINPKSEIVTADSVGEGVPVEYQDEENSHLESSHNNYSVVAKK